MFSRKALPYLLSSATCLLLNPICLAQDAGWREINAEAIQAMRSEKYSESEALFQKALGECKLPEDTQTVRANLAVLLKKLGRTEEAAALTGEEEKNKTTAAKTAALPDLHSGKISVEVNRAPVANPLTQIENAIQQAYKKNDLNTLQALYQKKAEYIRARDHSESAEYGAALHAQAQVLYQLRRDMEANPIEAHSARIRNASQNILRTFKPMNSLFPSNGGMGGSVSSIISSPGQSVSFSSTETHMGPSTSTTTTTTSSSSHSTMTTTTSSSSNTSVPCSPGSH